MLVHQALPLRARPERPDARRARLPRRRVPLRLQLGPRSREGPASSGASRSGPPPIEELLTDEEVERLGSRRSRSPGPSRRSAGSGTPTRHAAAPWWAENSKEAYSLGARRRSPGRSTGSRRRRRASGPAHVGFPRRKKSGHGAPAGSRPVRWRVVDDRHVQLPRIGVVRTKEQTTKLRQLLDGGRARILSATISEEAGRWFVSFGCEVERDDAPARATRRRRRRRPRRAAPRRALDRRARREPEGALSLRAAHGAAPARAVAPPEAARSAGANRQRRSSPVATERSQHPRATPSTSSRAISHRPTARSSSRT